MVGPTLVSQHSTRIEAVVVGASAGAVEALGVLLPPLPADMTASVVVVVHLSGRIPSLLPELFASKCAPRVLEPLDKQPVGSGTIWFAPPNYHLLIERERAFSLSIDEPVNYSRPSIDVLFESAAYAYGPALLALVLTGASRDGYEGALRVRQNGGLLAVQDPSTAVAPVLPRMVAERAEPHLVGSLDELSRLLLERTRGNGP